MREGPQGSAGQEAQGEVAAPAGEYHVYACRTPAGEVAPVDGWSGSVAAGGAYDDYAKDTCADGGALVAALGDLTTHIADVDEATWAFSVPAGERMVGATLWRAGDADGGSQAPRVERGRLEGRERVREVQRARLLQAALDVVGEYGWEGMSVERVTRRAGVSGRAFYQVFGSRENCFLVVFDGAVERLSVVAAQGFEQEGDWVGRLRGAVATLLEFLEYEPAIRRLVLIEAQEVGPRVTESRAGMLQELVVAIDQGRRETAPGHRPPHSAAKDALDGALGVLERWLLQPRLLRQSYLLEPQPVPLTELLGS